MKTQRSWACDIIHDSWIAPTDHIDYMSKNYVAVRIYYGQMSYQSVEEKKAYDAFDLVGRLHCVEQTTI